VATDGFDRYPSVLEWLAGREGTQNRDLALRRSRSSIARRRIGSSKAARRGSAGTPKLPCRAAGGKTVEALQMQRDRYFWREQRVARRRDR